MNHIKKGLVVVSAFAGVSLSAAAAKADYLCSANYTPLDTLGLGNNGYIRFTTYTEPDCTGSFTGVFNFCTIGATSSSCIANTSMHYTNAELLELASATRDALIWDVRVNVFGNSCIGGGGFCVGYLEFRAN